METQRLLQLNTEASQGFWVMQAILPHWNCSRRLHVAHSPWPHLDMQHTLHTVCLWPKQCMEEGWKINTPAHKCLKINLQSQNVTVLFFLGGCFYFVLLVPTHCIKSGRWVGKAVEALQVEPLHPSVPFYSKTLMGDWHLLSTTPFFTHTQLLPPHLGMLLSNPKTQTVWGGRCDETSVWHPPNPVMSSAYNYCYMKRCVST